MFKRYFQGKMVLQRNLNEIVESLKYLCSQYFSSVPGLKDCFKAKLLPCDPKCVVRDRESSLENMLRPYDMMTFSKISIDDVMLACSCYRTYKAERNYPAHLPWIDIEKGEGLWL